MDHYYFGSNKVHWMYTPTTTCEWSKISRISWTCYWGSYKFKNIRSTDCLSTIKNNAMNFKFILYRKCLSWMTFSPVGKMRRRSNLYILYKLKLLFSLIPSSAPHVGVPLLSEIASYGPVNGKALRVSLGNISLTRTRERRLNRHCRLESGSCRKVVFISWIAYNVWN